ncbi:hypothetical protein ABEB36_005678 [Hypothenemus hampei]|uniref:Uncharacterized protein n=1 Tax=Hypothenemus hampei TaxID=57062 RepID=A0ABD1EZ22_HYPHA
MKAVILIFSLYILNVRPDCPNSCSCTPSSVSCVNLSLESVPDLNSLESSPVILDFSGNKFLFLDQEDFNFPKDDEVVELYLNNSEIVDIGKGTFDKLENLQELYLKQNFFSNDSIPEDLIESLDNMVFLDMSENYFNGAMPIIRSDSLEVLALINCKITSIPENALEHLPNLKLLLLERNDIQHLSFEPFQHYTSSSIFIKLTFNSGSCTCHNLHAFYLLANHKFIDTSELYQCINDENKLTNIFDGNVAINLTRKCPNINKELLNNLFGFPEVRDMIEDTSTRVFNLISNDIEDDYEDDAKTIDDCYKDIRLPEYCWQTFADTYERNNNFLTMVVVTTLISFVIGFLSGIVWWWFITTCRCRHMEHTSDSQIQLIHT